MQQGTRTDKMEYTNKKQMCKGYVPEMVINAKGKIRWHIGQGKIRSGHCTLNQGSHKGITEKVTYQKRTARGKRMIQVAMGGRARQTEEGVGR